DADQGARAEPQVRERRRGARAGRTLDAALQAEEAGALLLVRPAVPERDVSGLAHPAAEALQGLPRRREARRRPEEVRVRVPELHAAEVHEQEVRVERLAG